MSFLKLTERLQALRSALVSQDFPGTADMTTSFSAIISVAPGATWTLSSLEAISRMIGTGWLTFHWNRSVVYDEYDADDESIWIEVQWDHEKEDGPKSPG